MTAKFRNVGSNAVTPPDRAKPVEPGRSGSTDSEEWCRRLERAGNIRRTDGRSTVFPTRKKRKAKGKESDSGSSD